MKKATEPGIVERYQRLMEISRDLASTLDLDSALARIVAAAAELTAAEAASILLYDDSSGQLFFQMSTSMQEYPVMRGLTVPVEGSLAGWVVTHRQPVVVANTSLDERHYDGVDRTTQLTTTSLIGIPLITRDKLIGVLELINKPGGFTPDDQAILTALGAQAAVAIQNTRLFQQSDLIDDLVQELRTPLSSICTISYMMQRPDMPAEQRQSLAATFGSEAQRLNDMASAFLDLARLESGRTPFNFSVFDLPTLLEECVILYKIKADEKKLRLSVELAANLPQIEADREKIKQVIMALLSNAIKFNHSGGAVTVIARAQGGEALIEVKDTGIGIPADDIPQLFRKFNRARSGDGSGLGLAICKRIVDSHRGRIEVSSQVGAGTIVAVRLPVRQA
jgi:signal transduction histidine kinase